jgi:hypothetical protein
MKNLRRFKLIYFAITFFWSNWLLATFGFGGRRRDRDATPLRPLALEPRPVASQGSRRRAKAECVYWEGKRYEPVVAS